MTVNILIQKTLKNGEKTLNIMIINHYAGSKHHGMEFRPYYMAREWKKNGHNVVIVGASYSHIRQKNPDMGSNPLITEVVDGIKYVWLKTCAYKSNNANRVINVLQFVNKLKKNAEKLANEYKPDAVIASSTYPIDVKAAKKIADISGGRLYFEIHDLNPMTPMVTMGMSEKNPIIRVLQNGEDFAFEKSDKVISILSDADKHIRERGFNTPYVHIPNGIIPEEVQEFTTEKIEQIETLRQLKKDGYFIIAYTGNHSQANDLGCFIKASCEFSPEDKVKFVLVGTGADKPYLQKLAQEEKAENMLFLESVPKSAMHTLLREVDVAYLGLKKSPLYHYGCSPNKLFDYMLASKPVVYAVEAPNNLIEASGCGITTTASDPKAVAKAVKKLYNCTNEELEVMGQKGKEYVLENHKYENLAQRFLEALKD